jgi:hypothetical protein
MKYPQWINIYFFSLVFCLFATYPSFADDMVLNKFPLFESSSVRGLIQPADWEHSGEWYHRHRCFLEKKRVWSRRFHQWVIEPVWVCPAR